MITGDSVGGGLAISLLSHLLHPYLDVPCMSLPEPLRGAVLYSPWASFDTYYNSYMRNAVKDTLVPRVLRKWAGMYLGTVERDTDPGIITGGNNYSEPLLANPPWWEGINNVVACVWIWGGENEVFIDSLHTFGGWGFGKDGRLVVG